jgi:hypothetical protein
MTHNENILRVLEGGPLTARQIAEITQLPAGTVKICLLALVKKQKLTREKKERLTPGMGPKLEFVYARPSL